MPRVLGFGLPHSWQRCSKHPRLRPCSPWRGYNCVLRTRGCGPVSALDSLFGGDPDRVTYHKTKITHNLTINNNNHIELQIKFNNQIERHAFWPLRLDDD